MFLSAITTYALNVSKQVSQTNFLFTDFWNIGIDDNKMTCSYCRAEHVLDECPEGEGCELECRY
jgi:hypothetical protein